jgi:hypothetical protein
MLRVGHACSVWLGEYSLPPHGGPFRWIDIDRGSAEDLLMAGK